MAKKPNKDLFAGAAGAILLHGVVLFVVLPKTTTHYEVVVAPSVLEVSLVATPKKVKKVEKPPVKEPPPPPPVEEPDIRKEIPEPEIETEPKETVEEIEEDVPEPVEEEPPEVNELQGATMDVQPLAHRNQPPEYPRQARRGGWEGRVVLDVLISKEGAVKSIDVVTSSGYAILDTEAVKAIERWLFAPAQILGRAVEKHIEIPILFQLEHE